MLGLCALGQAFHDCPDSCRDYQNIHPAIHALQGTPSEQWLVQGILCGNDPAVLMLRISAGISFRKMSGGERQELPESVRPLDNLATLVEGGRIGHAMLRVIHGIRTIWVHPDCFIPCTVSWWDEMYWRARIKGHGHDCVRSSLDKQPGEEFDGACGCQLSGR